MATDDTMHASEASTGEVHCPSCGESMWVEVTRVVTPGTTVLNELFRGRLNVVECAACGECFALATPLIFRDDEEHFVIYCLPLEDRSAWQETEQRVAEMSQRIFAELPAAVRPECRLTFHRRNFIEKIAAHSAGLEDRLLEYIKYQLYNRPHDPIDPIRSELLLDFSTDDDRKLVFLIFDRETGEATAAAHIPMATYDELASAFRTDDGLAEELTGLFPGPYVSVERLYD